MDTQPAFIEGICTWNQKGRGGRLEAGDIMGMMKQYFLRLLEAGDTDEEQQAIEAAIRNNWIHLTYHLKKDQEEILLEKSEFVHRLEESRFREAEPRASTPEAKRGAVRGRRKPRGTEVQNTPEARSKKLRREKAVDSGKRVRVKK